MRINDQRMLPSITVLAGEESDARGCSYWRSGDFPLNGIIRPRLTAAPTAMAWSPSASGPARRRDRRAPVPVRGNGETPVNRLLSNWASATAGKQSSLPTKPAWLSRATGPAQPA